MGRTAHHRLGESHIPWAWPPWPSKRTNSSRRVEERPDATLRELDANRHGRETHASIHGSRLRDPRLVLPEVPPVGGLQFSARNGLKYTGPREGRWPGCLPPRVRLNAERAKLHTLIIEAHEMGPRSRSPQLRAQAPEVALAGNPWVSPEPGTPTPAESQPRSGPCRSARQREREEARKVLMQAATEPRDRTETDVTPKPTKPRSEIGATARAAVSRPHHSPERGFDPDPRLTQMRHPASTQSSRNDPLLR
jgi:hypothetical protein